ncbi:unknown [Clostridium sp. CAG:448]|nr:unknown [Clostridium sp. CAG:448]
MQAKISRQFVSVFAVRVIDRNRIRVRKVRTERREHFVHGSYAVKQRALFSFAV